MSAPTDAESRLRELCAVANHGWLSDAVKADIRAVLAQLSIERISCQDATQLYVVTKRACDNWRMLIEAAERALAERDAALRALETKWRGMAAQKAFHGLVDAPSTLSRCADDLAIALHRSYEQSPIRVREPETVLREPSGQVDLVQLAKCVRMLGLLPGEHPYAAVYNEALTLVATYLLGFIGREQFLPHLNDPKSDVLPAFLAKLHRLPKYYVGWRPLEGFVSTNDLNVLIHEVEQEQS